MSYTATIHNSVTTTPRSERQQIYKRHDHNTAAQQQLHDQHENKYKSNATSQHSNTAAHRKTQRNHIRAKGRGADYKAEGHEPGYCAVVGVVEQITKQRVSTVDRYGQREEEDDVFYCN